MPKAVEKTAKQILKELEEKQEKARDAIKDIDAKQAEFRKDLRSEFRKQAFTAITAALALVIALSWREPIDLAVKNFIAWLGIPTEGIYPKILVTIIITILAAVALVIVSRWANKENKEEKK